MSLIIFRHSQDRNHRNASLFAVLTACTLIHGRKVCVHITRISTTARYFFSCCRHFTQRIRIVGNICQNNQHMHITLKCQIFCGSQRHFRCRNSLNRRIIRQIYEQNCPINCSCFFETLHKKVRLFKGNSHCSKYNRKFFIRSKHLGLSCNLCSQFRMRKTGC